MSAALDFLRGDWTDDRPTVVSFAKALATVDGFVGALDAVWFFEKPHKWSNEFRRWDSLGRPDSRGTNDAKWDVILGRVNLSPEAMDLIAVSEPRCIATGSDADAVKELAAAGLIDLDDVDWSDAQRTTVYGWTAAGRVYVAEEFGS